LLAAAAPLDRRAFAAAVGAVSDGRAAGTPGTALAASRWLVPAALSTDLRFPGRVFAERVRDRILLFAAQAHDRAADPARE
jgi:hypothetical protein